MAVVLILMSLSWIGVCCWIACLQGRKTDRRGSEFYVPKFHAEFDAFERTWTTERRVYVYRDKAQWQVEFDALLRSRH